MGIIGSKNILGIKNYPASKELDSIYNSSPAYAFIWRPEEHWPVEFVSKNIKLLGYSPEDFKSGRILYSGIVHPDDIEKLNSTLMECQEREDRPFFNLEYRILDSSGNVHWVSERSIIKRNSKGLITHLKGLIIDITDMKQAEEALDSALDRTRELDFVINNSPIVVFLCKAEEGWPVEFVSDNAELLGYTVDDFKSGRFPYGDIIHPDDLDYVRSKVSRHSEDGSLEYS